MTRTGKLISLVLLLCMLTSGCAAFIAGAAVGGAGVVWHKGRLIEVINAQVPDVHKAATAALKDLDIKTTEDKGDSLTAKLRAKLADGRDIWVDMDAEEQNKTKLTIRVGLLGDEEFSRRILLQTKKHL